MSSSAVDDNTRPPTHGQGESLRGEWEFRFCGDELIGSVRVSGLKQIGSLVGPIMARLAATLCNDLPEEDGLRRLSAIADSDATSDAKRENRKLGRMISSRVRRLQKLGRDRRTALQLVAVELSQTAPTAEILAKLHNKARDERIERDREVIVKKALARGLKIREIAKRLNVSPQHAGRLVAELKNSQTIENAKGAAH